VRVAVTTTVILDRPTPPAAAEPVVIPAPAAIAPPAPPPVEVRYLAPGEKVPKEKRGAPAIEVFVTPIEEAPAPVVAAVAAAPAAPPVEEEPEWDDIVGYRPPPPAPAAPPPEDDHVFQPPAPEEAPPPADVGAEEASPWARPPEPERSDLWRLLDFDEGAEEALGRAAIRTLADLSGRDAGDLAASTGVNETRLQEWIHVANLKEEVGVPVDAAIALVAAGIAGPRGLQDTEAEDVVTKVGASGGGASVQLKDVKRWKRRA
jgi:Domain of unknown function (DUF4332)